MMLMIVNLGSHPYINCSMITEAITIRGFLKRFIFSPLYLSLLYNETIVKVIVIGVSCVGVSKHVF